MNTKIVYQPSSKPSESIVYSDAFSFVIGQIAQLSDLHEKHQAERFNQVDTLNLYNLAERTCRAVLMTRQSAAKDLSVFIAARYALYELLNSNQTAERSELASDLQKEIDHLVSTFIQSQCSISALNAEFETLTRKKLQATEKDLLEYMEQSRRNILIETAQMLTRCDSLKQTSD